ncbi:UDP-N-acetylglucosamine transferase subunit ALG14 [Vibrio sp. SCSIO 43136]|uniref:UDP-N-acetylglucosamine transferase subunit ALG14 n=1 Tax=Vibrio sp. SCSIO 43136 TaxID=2819101 RepID=UPI0020761DB7|nr:UDP-N-acetylglucosamine transferase subunit ALG14 [Vibrio sp. SCSIO 43136]USD67037.1 hypothetical protein J4N39_20590 [Vibrio sp. SCSIO 43136]
MKKRKVLTIASSGGHNVQLCRLFNKIKHVDVKHFHVRTRVGSSDIVNNDNEFLIDDISRDSLIRTFKVVYQLYKVISKTNPDLIVTTGALPGLLGLILGRVFRLDTIWIDSIANTQKLSLSGRIAKHIAGETITQWEHLEEKHVSYYGNVI